RGQALSLERLAAPAKLRGPVARRAAPRMPGVDPAPKPDPLRGPDPEGDRRPAAIGPRPARAPDPHPGRLGVDPEPDLQRVAHVPRLIDRPDPEQVAAVGQPARGVGRGAGGEARAVEPAAEAGGGV